MKFTSVKEFREYIDEFEEGVAADDRMLRLDEEEADACIVGISRSFEGNQLIYDYDKLVRMHMRRDGMTREESIEFLEFNTLGAYMGKGTPGFIVATLVVKDAKEKTSKKKPVAKKKRTR